MNALIEAANVPRIQLARLPTPLVPLRRFSQKHNIPTIWLKRDDLTDTAASGNKLRKLEFTIAQALQQGASTLITIGGVQSNHCRATAIIASQLGLKSHLVLRGRKTSPADGNLLLDELVGARITYVSTAEYADIDQIISELMRAYREQGEVPYAIPIGASDEIGLWGYIEASRELQLDFENANIEPGYVVSAAGSGGTAGGLILGHQLYALNNEVYSFNVCDDEAYFIRKIGADFQSWRKRYEIPININNLKINIVDRYVGPGYGKAEPPVIECIKDLARTEGVILDPVYTGKAFQGLMTELGSGSFSTSNDIVFIHTGGIFGLFPQKDTFVS
ncbi:MAG: D-cysteine desulfhydrase family protein [bacterium]|nr:D-cysteine desulfhydrase family protein [Gammaproteobacteria bacterium]HIL95096.1 D-cysteine desulfhydrase family protein [Pseudomonadales bacterium]